MTKNGGYTIEVDPDKLDELASGIGTAEMKCSFALSKLKWGMGSIAADIAGVGGGNINHLQEKFEGSIKKYKDLLDDSQAFVKKTAADVRQLDQSWQAKLGRTVGEFSGWYDLQRTFGEYDPQTGEKITGGQRAEAGVMTILNFSPGKAIGVFAKGGKMAKTAKIGQEASALGKIKSGRKAVNPAVFKDFFSGAWNSMKGRFRSAKEYIVKGKEAVKRVRENIGKVEVPVGVRVADTGVGMRTIVPEKRSIKDLTSQFAVKVKSNATKKVDPKYDNLPKIDHRGYPYTELDEVIAKGYNAEGKVAERWVVPKGYESVEHFLKHVDDKTIKEYGYDSVEEFKTVTGLIDKHLNASSRHSIINKSLAGSTHEKGVDYDVLGLPIFKGDAVKFTTNLREDLFIARDPDQFGSCTNALKEAIDKGEISKDLFTEKQLAQINRGKAKIQDLTWHHHQVPGKMQLVVTNIHQANHLGGNKLWGEGIR
ncbi:HNH endonuclease [Priestia filamentosa]|uniref:HNH endonuclease n=1 Tax=Priestia filamentosa TaxID=1402861 RepID=UPI0009E1E1F3